jgi:ABC-2 type transport system ATP-binding protein
MSLSLYVNDLAVSYGKFRLSHISFQLKGGDILGLVGKSGSGKSTVIKALLGIKKPISGKIELYQENRETLLKEVIGYSPQENSLYPFLTLYENLLTFGRLYGMNRPAIEERISLLLRRLDLSKNKHTRITHLSGGMQKRADIAVALIHDPWLVILDEPFNGLDVSLQKFIWAFMKELAAEGKIILISSHILKDIEKHCNQFGLVSNGTFYNNDILLSQFNVKRGCLESFLEQLFEKEIILERGEL